MGKKEKIKKKVQCRIYSLPLRYSSSLSAVQVVLITVITIKPSVLTTVTRVLAVVNRLEATYRGDESSACR